MCIRIIVFCLFLTSCGIAESITNEKSGPRAPIISIPCTFKNTVMSIDPELESVVQEFFKDAEERGKTDCIPLLKIALIDGEITIPDSTGTVLGVCNSQFRTIYIVKKYWEGADLRWGPYFAEVWRKSLMYHEIGHCSLNLKHSKKEDVNIMNPYALSPYITEENWPAMVDKLFNGDISGVK